MKKQRSALRKIVTRPVNLAALFVLLAALALVFVVQRATGVDLFTSAGAQHVVESAGLYAPILYILVLSVTVVISPLPGVPLAIAAGMIWGPFMGTVLSVAGGFLGSIASYAVGRTLGRSVVAALTGRAIHFSADRGQRYLAVVVLITRLIPLLSFDIVSYAAGLSRQRFDYYVAATLIGMTPTTYLLTVMGSTVRVDPIFGLIFSGIAAALIFLIPVALRRWNLFGLNDLFWSVVVDEDESSG